MQLNQDTIKLVRQPIVTVWNYIGHDIIDMVEDNDCAIEMCIDADRLITYAESPDTQILIRELIEEHGYNKVLKFLSDNICFV